MRNGLSLGYCCKDYNDFLLSIFSISSLLSFARKYFRHVKNLLIEKIEDSIKQLEGEWSKFMKCCFLPHPKVLGAFLYTLSMVHAIQVMIPMDRLKKKVFYTSHTIILKYSFLYCLWINKMATVHGSIVRK